MLVWPESSLSELNHNPIERISSCFRLNYIWYRWVGYAYVWLADEMTEWVSEWVWVYLFNLYNHQSGNSLFIISVNIFLFYILKREEHILLSAGRLFVLPNFVSVHMLRIPHDDVSQRIFPIGILLPLSQLLCCFAANPAGASLDAVRFSVLIHMMKSSWVHRTTTTTDFVHDFASNLHCECTPRLNLWMNFSGWLTLAFISIFLSRKIAVGNLKRPQTHLISWLKSKLKAVKWMQCRPRCSLKCKRWKRVP